MQDYGGPVGFRIVSRHPEALAWLIVQNTNAYEVGFTEAWAGLRNALWKNRTPETEQGVAGLLEFDTTSKVTAFTRRSHAVHQQTSPTAGIFCLRRPQLSPI